MKPPKKIKFHSPRTPHPFHGNVCDLAKQFPSFGGVPEGRGGLELETTDLTDWIDAQIVMQSLHISPRTLQTLRSNGTLPFSRIRGKIYYRKTDLQKILQNNYTLYKIHNLKSKI